MNDSFTNWLIAGGARLVGPDPRALSHLVALREAKRDETHRSPLAGLAEGLGFGSHGRAATNPTTLCCAA